VRDGCILPAARGGPDQPIFRREMLGIRFLKGMGLWGKMKKVFRFYAVLKTIVKTRWSEGFGNK
jgi:hypothetical protein